MALQVGACSAGPRADGMGTHGGVAVHRVMALLEGALASRRPASFHLTPPSHDPPLHIRPCVQGKPGFGSFRSIPSGPKGAAQREAWAKKENKTMQEEIDGWLGCMGVGCRTASVVPANAIQDLRDGKISDYREHPDVVTISHGPYLDDWSKVPPEIAAKYNTGPPQ